MAAIFAAMNRAAIYILLICGLGGFLACAAFVWAALRGEFTDCDEAAFLVFDDDEPLGPGKQP